MPITPAQLAAPGDEHSHQKALFQWAALSASQRWPSVKLLHAIPNGSRLMGTGTQAGRIEGGKMKAEGLRAGVPDVFLPVGVPMGKRLGAFNFGLYIEMKKPGRQKEAWGGRSVEQVQWQRDLLAQGYAVATCYGWQSATHVLAMYLQSALVMPDDGDCYFALPTELPPF